MWNVSTSTPNLKSLFILESSSPAALFVKANNKYISFFCFCQKNHKYTKTLETGIYAGSFYLYNYVGYPSKYIVSL